MKLPCRSQIFGHLTAAAIACAAMTSTGSMAADNEQATTGPIRLVDSATRTSAANDEPGGRPATSTTQPYEQLRAEPLRLAQASEFEAYVSGLAGTSIRRLGAELMQPSRNTALIESNRQVPPDYIVGFGDEIQLTTWGAVDADLRLTVDRAGRIVIPRVGPVVVAGIRHGDLNELLTRRVGQVFKNFQLSATLGRLRSIRFYVTGFAVKPGGYSVSSLATVLTGLAQSGGPSAAGSFRNIELRRNGQTIAQFDLYDLLVRGDKKGDIPLQSDDVLHVGPYRQLQPTCRY
jgi:protein involved in polysaccharide export with SLBB domain